MYRNNKIFWLLGLLLVQLMLLLSACGDDAIPKPRAYFRIDIPEYEYISFDTSYPFRFEYADYSIISNAQREGHPYWLNIDYPEFKARIYLSYSFIEGNVQQMLADAHELAYKHIAVANDIQQDIIINPKRKVYGMIYHIKGAKVASPINFFITDSVQHFVRGALYFSMTPQNDSLKPVIEGVEKDILHLIHSFQWKEIED